MKKLAGIVVILTALILSSYYVMGYLTQRKITESLKGINLTNDLSVSMVDYQRGWFTSKVAFTWQLTLPKYTSTTVDGQTKDIPAANYQLPMPVTVYHGPVIFSDKGIKFGLGYAHTKLALPPNAVEAFNDLFTAASIQPTLALRFFVNYLGNSNVDVSLPPFELLPKDGSGEFNWSGLQATTHFHPRMNKVDGHVKLNGVQFAEDRLKVISSSVTSNYNLHETPMGYYLGTANLSFPSMQISQDTNKLLELKQFQVESHSDIVDNLFNTDFSVTIDQIFVANLGNYDSAHLKVDIRNLDAQALANIDEEIKKTQQISTPNQDRSLLGIMNQLPGVFGKGAEIEIKQLDFVTPEGKINANFLLTFPKYDAPNMFNLLQKLKAHGKLVLPADVVKKLLLIQANLISPHSNGQPGVNPAQQGQEKLPNNHQQLQTPPNKPDGTQPAIIPVEQRLSAMLKSGFMKSDGSYYTIEVQYEQGNLLINGQPFNTNMLNF